jgi:hypothetical protein
MSFIFLRVETFIYFLIELGGALSTRAWILRNKLETKKTKIVKKIFFYILKQGITPPATHLRTNEFLE